MHCTAQELYAILCNNPYREKNLKRGDICIFIDFPGDSVVKTLPANTRDAGDAGSIPGSGRFPGIGKSNPLQYSCPGNPMDRGA